MRLRWSRIFGAISIFGISCPLYPMEFYEKIDIRKRLETREIISVVTVDPHPSKKEWEALNIKVVGLMDNLSVSQAMALMTDYEKLEKIAPEYISSSSLKKGDGTYEKYIHIRAHIKTFLITYKVETYVKVYEEKTPDQAIIHCEVIPAESIGEHIEDQKFVGFKGKVIVQKNKSYPTSRTVKTRAKNQLQILFLGNMEKEEMSKIIPNFMLQIAMEVALQKVGVLLRKYLEASNEFVELPRPIIATRR